MKRYACPMGRNMLRKCSVVILLILLAACGSQEPFGTDQHGALIPKALLDEQWLVINYWAIWCAPCRQEVPELNELHHQLHSQGVRVLGVNYDQLQGAELLADSQQLGIEFPVFSSDPAVHFNLPKTQGLPATYIVNPHGQLAGTMHGEQSKESILIALEQLGWSSP